MHWWIREQAGVRSWRPRMVLCVTEVEHLFPVTREAEVIEFTVSDEIRPDARMLIYDGWERVYQITVEGGLRRLRLGKDIVQELRVTGDVAWVSVRSTTNTASRTE